MDIIRINRTPRFITIITFIILLVFSWANEILDLPHLILNAPSTPVNFKEAAIESVFIIISGSVLSWLVAEYESRLKSHIEGIHTICSNCHCVREEGNWLELDVWIARETEAVFSHGLCPKCLKELYPDLYEKMIEQGVISENGEPLGSMVPAKADNPSVRSIKGQG